MECFFTLIGAPRVKLNARFLVFGVLLVVVGGAVFAFPQYVSPPATVYDHTMLAQIRPGNYTYVQASLTPQETLQASLSSSPASVDFFLMNSSTFSMWNSKSHPSVDVYPQSRLNVKNYSFVFTASSGDVYSLVFVSRPNSSNTNVLVHLVIQRGPAFLETFLIPGALIVLGAASAGYGATRKPKPKVPSKD